MSKRQVESCLILAAPRTRRAVHFLETHHGAWTWPKYGYSFPYTFTRIGSAAYLGLWGRQTIELEATSPNYGGVRWWWLCPRCDRRASRLYLPNRERLFLCRVCHDLSYESAQNSRAFYYELFKMDARRFRCSSRVVREAVRGSQGGYVVADLIGQAEAFA